MIALLRTELRRYWSRRAVRFVGLLILLGILLAGVLVFVNSGDSPEARADALRERERMVEQCVESFEGGDQGQLPPGEDATEICEQEIFPIEDTDDRFHLSSLPDIYQGTIVFLIILGIGLGASFIGAEWGAGTMTTHLTWEPRRARVLTTKVLSGALFVFLAAVGVLVVLGLALVPAAAFAGSMEGLDGEWLRSTAGIVLRGGLVAGFGAALGFSLASLARNTAAAIVAGFVYFAVLEGMLRGLRPQWQRWLIGDNAGLFIAGEGDFQALDYSRTRAGIVLALYGIGLFLLALAFFRRRDVT